MGFCLFAIEATLFCLHPRVELITALLGGSSPSCMRQTNGQNNYYRISSNQSNTVYHHRAEKAAVANQTMTATERGVVTTVLKYQVQNPSCTSWQNNDQMCGWPYFSKSVLASTLPSPGDSFMWFQPNLTKTFLGPRYSSPKSSLLSSPSLFETHLGINNRNHHRLHIPISPFFSLPWMPRLVLLALPHAVDHLGLAQVVFVGSMPPWESKNGSCVLERKNGNVVISPI